MNYNYQTIVAVSVFGIGLVLIGYFAPVSLKQSVGSFVEHHFTELSYQYDDFALGQHYFNHSERKDGAYDLDKARTYYQQAVTKDPLGHPLAWHQLGRIAFLEGEFEVALDHFDTQLEYFSDAIPNTYYMIALTHGYAARESGSIESWQQAEENFKTYLTYDSLSPWARVDLAWVYFAQGKYSEMIPVLETGLTYHGANPWLLNMYGLALLNTNDRQKAAVQFELARTQAANLTVEEWGKSYPGNHPDHWQRGLQEFQEAIEKNYNIATQPT